MDTKQLQEWFNSVDRDKDGLIKADELVSAPRTVPPTQPYVAPLRAPRAPDLPTHSLLAYLLTLSEGIRSYRGAR